MASELGLQRLPLSHKKDARLKWIKTIATRTMYLHFIEINLGDANKSMKNYPACRDNVPSYQINLI